MRPMYKLPAPTSITSPNASSQRSPSTACLLFSLYLHDALLRSHSSSLPSPVAAAPLPPLESVDQQRYPRPSPPPHPSAAHTGTACNSNTLNISCNQLFMKCIIYELIIINFAWRLHTDPLRQDHKNAELHSEGISEEDRG